MAQLARANSTSSKGRLRTYVHGVYKLYKRSFMYRAQPGRAQKEVETAWQSTSGESKIVADAAWLSTGWAGRRV